MNIEELKKAVKNIREEVGKVIIGQEKVIDLALMTVMTGHHSLIEGVPGVAKTVLVKTLAAVFGCDSQRIQFTPDLMPADITGTNVYNLKANEFVLVRGPVFTTFLLADEINRAPAKTQSALLQAMQERSVTIDRETHGLPQCFTVFATQNPIEFEGTYPLPEAQKDRFMFKILMDCPDRDGEIELARRMLGEDAPENVLKRGGVSAVMSIEDLAGLKPVLDNVDFREELTAYVVDIIRETREHSSILVGAGPRATQHLVSAARACACLADRDFVTPDDIKDMAVPVLGHRLILRPEFEIEGVSVNEVIGQVLDSVAVPR